MSEYVVAGCGIIGLYSAYELIHTLGVDPEKITVIAQFLPGDQSINYTSPWAGGNFSAISSSDEDSLEFDKYTYTHLKKLQMELGGPACGLDNKPSTELFEQQPSKAKIDSVKSYVKDFKQMRDVPEDVVFGFTYTTWNFNCPAFLANFQSHLESLGVTFQRKTLRHISQAYISDNTKVVINCTGIGARTLGGVLDKDVYPTRGQVVVVRAPHIQENMMQWGDNKATYIIPRPYSNDELILGGFVQKGDFTADTLREQTDDIIKRTTKLLPKILDQPLIITRVAAGLRPSRQGGVRIELEKFKDGKLLLHNYGASGYGYQSGLGMAHKAVQLLQKRSSKL